MSVVAEIECLDHEFRHEVAMASVREHLRTFQPGTLEQQIDACRACGRWQDDKLMDYGVELADGEVYCACCRRIFKVSDSPMDSVLDVYSESFYAGIAAPKEGEE